MSDQYQASSPTTSASQASPARSDKTLIFPPLSESPTSPYYGNQLFRIRNRLSPDRWSIEATEAICPRPTAEEIFDRLMAEQPQSCNPKTVKPSFEPVYYDPEKPPRKYRRLAARAHEKELKKKLADSGLTAKEIELYATNASYYPGVVGSKYEPVREWSFAMTPPRIALTSEEEEEEDSPRYLFKDLPAELPKKKIQAIIQPNTPTSQASLERDRNSLILPPITPNRRSITDGMKTPMSSFVNLVDHLSPVFDKLNVAHSTMLEKKSLATPSACIHEAPESAARCVPFIRTGPMESGREPDNVIGAFRLEMQRTSDGAPTSSTEPISSCPLSSKDSVSTQPSPGYKPVHPIVLSVPKSATTKYQALLDKFCRDFSVEIVDGPLDLEKVTHAIFDDENTEEAKLHNVQAIGFQKYLIRMNWVQDCASNGSMLDPALYEVEVPPSRVARTSSVALFAGCAFLCAKPFVGIDCHQLWALLAFNGGSIVFNPADFANHPDKTRICIVGDLKFYEEPRNKRQLRHKLQPCKCIKVHYQWVFEALAAYDLPPMIEYLFDSSLEEMRAAEVPEDLIN